MLLKNKTSGTKMISLLNRAGKLLGQLTQINLIFTVPVSYLFHCV